MRRACHAAWGVVGAVLLLAASNGAAQQGSGDRERAQIRQLQQQLQKLQQDNAALQRDRDQAASRARTADDAKKELASVRAGASTARREVEQLRRDNAELRSGLDRATADLSRLQAELKQRDEALASAQQAITTAQRRAEIDGNVLAARLRQQTVRADHCEARHALAVQVGGEAVDLVERERLRLCEPLTGLWRVREETRVQALRDRLLDARLELPPEPSPRAASDAPAR
jgi:DNA repair exonuclease SbcCD ATPase subunit